MCIISVYSYLLLRAEDFRFASLTRSFVKLLTVIYLQSKLKSSVRFSYSYFVIQAQVAVLLGREGSQL